jgi:hypothetical protein
MGGGRGRSRGGREPADDLLETLQAALDRELGLKLEVRKAPVDRGDRPREKTLRELARRATRVVFVAQARGWIRVQGLR